MKTQFLLLLAALPLIAACNEPRPIDFSHVAFERPFEPATDPNPFRANESAVMLAADFGKPDSQSETIRFDSPPPRDVEAESKQIAQVVSDQVAAKFAGFGDDAGKLDRVLNEIADLKRTQLTKDDVRVVVKEELAIFGKQLLVDWKDAQGKVSTAAVKIDEKGVGTVALPPGAVVTAMGGIPIEQWRAQNPGAVVGGGGSNGGSVSTVQNTGHSNGSVSTSATQQSVPIAIAQWESEVTAPVQYYESPGQFQSSVGSYPDHTQMSVQVAPEYLQPASSPGQCVNGVCPNTAQPSVGSPTRSGPLRRIFGR